VVATDRRPGYRSSVLAVLGQCGGEEQYICVRYAMQCCRWCELCDDGWICGGSKGCLRGEVVVEAAGERLFCCM
jgi:hypothetical protein